MSQFQSLLMMLAGRWGSGLAGWAVVSILVWYVLPIVPVFREPGRRVATIVVLLALYFGVNLLLSFRRRRRERSLAAAIGGDAKGDSQKTSDDDARLEVAALRRRMHEALDRVGGSGRRGRRGRTLYERPWYVLIGPPGAGKTTALLQSGLHFPLAREMGAASIGGTGGTRLCDWWFADEAVLIDTAGRYTTQDSDEVIDKAGWLGFLDLLRRTRPRQPINGILVVMSAVDLATGEEQERQTHARAVRHRIDEIGERLRLKVPVYVVFSKMDRVQGFDAYFDDLDQSARHQVWGSTFAVDEGVAAFGDAFKGLLRRLDARLVERLQAERAAERRALIGTFPLQLASLAGPLGDFLRDAFTGSRLDPAPWLRGFYLTSATQEGSPIDRLTGMLMRSFGIDQARAPALQPVGGRTYFVTGLIRDLVLREALLVRDRPGRSRWRRGLRIAGFATIGAATAAALGWLWLVGNANRAAIAHEDEAIAAYRQSLAGITLDPVSGDDLPKVAALLDQAAHLDGGGAGIAAGLFGVSQAAKLRQSRHLAYENALDRILLPRLLWRLENEMRARFDQPIFLYEATRVYLMLGGEGPLDPALVRSWMEADWASRFPSELSAPLRARLLVHLDALLAEPLPPVPLDGALVEAARATFSRVTVPERIYTRIRADAANGADAPSTDQPGGTAPDWSPADALGPLGIRLFTRPSGAPLAGSIPGFLTAAGFRNAFEPALPAVTREVASESWVLGHDAEVPVDGPHLAMLQRQVAALWVNDAETHWDALLGDLALAPLGSPDAALRSLYVLGSPQSPMRDLLMAIVRGVTIAPSERRAPANGHGQRPNVSSLFAGQPTSESEDGVQTVIAAMDAHYGPLRSLVAGGAPSPIDDILGLINQLRSELAAAAPAISGGAASVPATLLGSGDPVASLLAEADRQPPPLSRWLRQLAVGGNAALDAAAHRGAAAAFESGGGSGGEGDGSGEDSPQALCHSVVDNHYPFDPNAASDSSIDDFARLFGPGGALDTYFQSQVRPFVDTSGSQWRAHALGGVAAPVDAASVASFERAVAIRDAFFISSGLPEVRFTLRPVSATIRATFSLGGTSVASDAPGPVAFTWPVAAGTSTASVSFVDKNGKTVAPTRSADGSWALFRLLNGVEVEPEGDPSRFDVTVNSNTASATFELVAGSSRNPFGHDLLAGFQCPTIR